MTRHDHDSSGAWHVLAQWAAPASGILAALVALGGTWWGAHASARSAIQQLSVETTKSHDEFVRAQRQRLYIKLSADQRQLRNSENHLKDILRNPSTKVTVDQFNKSKEKTLELQQVFYGDGEAVNMIGSKDVRLQAKALRDTHAKIWGDIQGLIPGRLDPNWRGPEPKVVDNSLWNALSILDNTRMIQVSLLYEAARRDMGVE